MQIVLIQVAVFVLVIVSVIVINAPIVLFLTTILKMQKQSLKQIRGDDMTDFNYSDETKKLFGNPEAFMKTPDFEKMLNGDMVGYDSPIRAIASQIEMSMDGEILKACQRVGVDVNKEELIKALNYDREQYEKGLKDGYARGYEQAKKDIAKALGGGIAYE